MAKSGRKPVCLYLHYFEDMEIGDWVNVPADKWRACAVAASRYGQLMDRRYLMRNIGGGLYRLMRFD